ncbi:MAG: sigma-70 family RNA polymerase sigma factor [Planctomycetota bacterium]|jgi:RNA polymerase sigma-70 factor (ECF subfamily)
MGVQSNVPRKDEQGGNGKARDQRASFEAIALPHLDAVYRMARTLCHDQVEAEDLAQETFSRAFRGFDAFELREYGARPWLLRILHNVFYTAKGKQRRDPTQLADIDFDCFEHEPSGGTGEPVSADTIDWDQVDEELKLEINRLQPEYRTVLLLWAIEELSYKEIADACDCPIGTVMSRLYRARQILGRRLHGYAREQKLNGQRLGA